MWPFHRRRDGSRTQPTELTAPAPDSAPLAGDVAERGWASLAPLARSVPAMDPTIATESFARGLASHTPPHPFLGPLGHLVSSDAPAGVVEGITTIAPSPAAAPASLAASLPAALRVTAAAPSGRERTNRCWPSRPSRPMVTASAIQGPRPVVLRAVPSPDGTVSRPEEYREQEDAPIVLGHPAASASPVDTTVPAKDETARTETNTARAVRAQRAPATGETSDFPLVGVAHPVQRAAPLVRTESAPLVTTAPPEQAEQPLGSTGGLDTTGASAIGTASAASLIGASPAVGTTESNDRTVQASPKVRGGLLPPLPQSMSEAVRRDAVGHRAAAGTPAVLPSGAPTAVAGAGPNSHAQSLPPLSGGSPGPVPEEEAERGARRGNPVVSRISDSAVAPLQPRLLRGGRGAPHTTRTAGGKPPAGGVAPLVAPSISPTAAPLQPSLPTTPPVARDGTVVPSSEPIVTRSVATTAAPLQSPPPSPSSPRRGTSSSAHRAPGGQRDGEVTIGPGRAITGKPTARTTPLVAPEPRVAPSGRGTVTSQPAAPPPIEGARPAAMPTVTTPPPVVARTGEGVRAERNPLPGPSLHTTLSRAHGSRLRTPGRPPQTNVPTGGAGLEASPTDMSVAQGGQRPSLEGVGPFVGGEGAGRPHRTLTPRAAPPTGTRATPLRPSEPAIASAPEPSVVPLVGVTGIPAPPRHTPVAREEVRPTAPTTGGPPLGAAAGAPVARTLAAEDDRPHRIGDTAPIFPTLGGPPLAATSPLVARNVVSTKAAALTEARPVVVGEGPPFDRTPDSAFATSRAVSETAPPGSRRRPPYVADPAPLAARALGPPTVSPSGGTVVPVVSRAVDTAAPSSSGHRVAQRAPLPAVPARRQAVAAAPARPPLPLSESRLSPLVLPAYAFEPLPVVAAPVAPTSSVTAPSNPPPVQRTSVAIPESGAASGRASGPGPVQTATSTTTTELDLDDLAGRLYDHILTRLRRDLRRELERKGRTAGLRR